MNKGHPHPSWGGADFKAPSARSVAGMSAEGPAARSATRVLAKEGRGITVSTVEDLLALISVNVEQDGPWHTPSLT